MLAGPREEWALLFVGEGGGDGPWAVGPPQTCQRPGAAHPVGGVTSLWKPLIWLL